jgi:hypothetical protein
MAAKDRYESLKGLSGAIIAVLWLDVVLQVLYVVSSVSVIGYMGDLLSGSVVVNDKSPDFSPAEIVQLIVALLSTLVTVSLYFMIGRWIFRAAWNVRHLGAKRLEYTPGWSVGWYFVPFANLVIPFRAMREIWLASHEPTRWRETSVGTLTLWWTLWLAGNIIGNISFRMSMGADTLEEMIRAEWIGVGLCVFSIPLSLVFMGIVRRVREAQDRSITLVQPPEQPELPDDLVTTAV